MKFFCFVLLLCLGSISEAGNLFPSAVKAPHAQTQPHRLEMHGDTRIDDFYWLKNKKDKNVIQYLKDENNYFNKMFKPLKGLKSKLISEMQSRIAENETSYPVKNGDYLYYARYEKKQQYPVYARKNLSPKGILTEEVIFDVNKLAQKNTFIDAHYKISPDGNLAALIFDSAGRRFYNIQFKDLRTGQILKTKLQNVTENLAWAADNETLFYIKQDENTLRHDKVYRLNLFSGKSELIYFETDETFDVYLSESLTKKHIFVDSESTLTSEIRAIDTQKPAEPPELLFEREKNTEIIISEDNDNYYYLTNKDAKNFKLMKMPFKKMDRKTPFEILSDRPDTVLENLIVFQNEVVLASRQNGLRQLELLGKNSKTIKKISYPDPSYVVDFGANAEYDSLFLRYNYESMKSVPAVYDYEFSSGKSFLRKTKKVTGYNSGQYENLRIFVTVRDGTKVPASLLMKKGISLNGTAGLFLNGYGAYGVDNEPGFSSEIFSLVDRGFIVGIVNVRGGGEFGRDWTDSGRVLKKKNTFFDFIDVTEYLIRNKYADPKKIFAEGESAGGLLIGFIANNRPELYKGLIADVPFVDALTTMLDESIPLTTGEYDEWGNPNDKTYYDYIKSYSPYDNVKPQAYPNLLTLTVLNDSQVQYWEPAKWIAKIRKNNKGSGVILLNTEMKASGHSGLSGRYNHLEEIANKFAFILAF